MSIVQTSRGLFSRAPMTREMGSTPEPTVSKKAKVTANYFSTGDTHGQQGLDLGSAIASEVAKLLGAEPTVEPHLGIGSPLHWQCQLTIQMRRSLITILRAWALKIRKDRYCSLSLSAHASNLRACRRVNYSFQTLNNDSPVD